MARQPSHLTNWMRRGLLLLLGSVGVALAVAAAIHLAERAMGKFLSQPCGHECDLTVKAVQIRPWGIELRELEFRNGNPKGEEWLVRAPKVRVNPAWRRLLKKEVAFRYAEIENAEVVLTDGGLIQNPPSPPPPFFVEALKIRDSKFRFVSKIGGREGAIGLDQIFVSSSAFGTIGEDSSRTTRVEASARLEKSGLVRLNFEARLFQSDPQLKLQIEISEQRLGELNHFFTPVEGIEISGFLHQASGTVVSDGVHLSSTTTARFSKVDAKLLPSPKNSWIAVFFGNLLRGLKLKTENLKDEKKDAIGRAEIKRMPKEQVVSFVLRGLKEALLKVAIK
jgi:hypothetical protein